MTTHAQHGHAVAQSLDSARAAAARDDFAEALAWLAMLENAGGELEPNWERTRASWVEGAVAAARRRYAEGDRL